MSGAASDADLVAAFEAGRPPAGGFGHREHARVAWLYLREEPLLPAIDRFRAALLCFARAQGAERRYHETMTCAYLVLIHERMARGRAGATWDEFAAANEDLFDRQAPILERYYRAETLRSELARRIFVLPDRATESPAGSASRA